MQMQEEIKESDILLIPTKTITRLKWFINTMVVPRILTIVFTLNKIDNLSHLCHFLSNWSVINGMTLWRLTKLHVQNKTNQNLIASLHWKTMRNRLVWQRWRKMRHAHHRTKRNLHQCVDFRWLSMSLCQNIKWRDREQYESFEWLWKWTLTFSSCIHCVLIAQEKTTLCDCAQKNNIWKLYQNPFETSFFFHVSTCDGPISMKRCE